MRWFIDAMNVIGSRPDGWWRDREGAVRRLVDEDVSVLVSELSEELSPPTEMTLRSSPVP